MKADFLTWKNLMTILSKRSHRIVAKVEYKYKIGHRERRCYRNYLFTSNTRPEFFVQDEDERRMLSIHFKKPKKLTSDELFEMWYTFVFECNLPAEKLNRIYLGIVLPLNSQVRRVKKTSMTDY